MRLQPQLSPRSFVLREPRLIDCTLENQNLRFCPFACQLEPQAWMRTRGKFRRDHPQGLVVHSTAGSSAESSISWGRQNGLAFWMITRDGTLIQTHPLNYWGWHAGESSWSNMIGTVSDELLGVELDNGGMLTKRRDKLFTWFEREVPPSAARYSEGRSNVVPGWYECFTPQQEETLIQLCLWLKRNNSEAFDLDLVLGHDEVSPGRKTDPGASLSWTMPEFRKLLKQKHRERSQALP